MSDGSSVTVPSPALKEAGRRASQVSRGLHQVLAATSGSSSRVSPALTSGDTEAAYVFDHLSDIEDVVRDCALEHAMELAAGPDASDIEMWLAEQRSLELDGPATSSAESAAAHRASSIAAALHHAVSCSTGRGHLVDGLVERGEFRAAYIEAALGFLADELRGYAVPRVDDLVSGPDTETVEAWLAEYRAFKEDGPVPSRESKRQEPQAKSPQENPLEESIVPLVQLMELVADGLLTVSEQSWINDLPESTVGVIGHLQAESARFVRDLRRLFEHRDGLALPLYAEPVDD